MSLLLRKFHCGYDTLKTDLLPNQNFHGIAYGFDYSKQSLKFSLNTCSYNLSTIKIKIYSHIRIKMTPKPKDSLHKCSYLFALAGVCS